MEEAPTEMPNRHRDRRSARATADGPWTARGAVGCGARSRAEVRAEVGL